MPNGTEGKKAQGGCNEDNKQERKEKSMKLLDDQGFNLEKGDLNQKRLHQLKNFVMVSYYPVKRTLKPQHFECKVWNSEALKISDMYILINKL